MKRLFVDMDGVLAEFKNVNTLETLYEEGYFRNLKPQQNVVDAIRLFMITYQNIEVYILSSVLTDSIYAANEKRAWLREHLPEINSDHILFVPCGANKKQFVPGTVTNKDFLLDDYTKNLIGFDPPGRGMKLLNGINHTHGTWKGPCLNFDHSPIEIQTAIINEMLKKQLVKNSLLQGRERG